VKAVRSSAAFTLVELLVVISIMGILAALVVPAVKSFGRAEAQASATRQMLDGVARARQLAISQRTTVYLVFVPENFWTALPPAEQTAAAKLYDKQLNSYGFLTLRGVGDQPGQPVARYLGPWRSLPEGNFIAAWKFNPHSTFMNLQSPGDPAEHTVYGFETSRALPFPTAESPTNLVNLPFIAFNHLGQLVSGQDEYIPLARGTLAHAYSPAKEPLPKPPFVEERPPGNSINNFNLIRIDWLTGRARVERQEVK
jgi:prepilin-type N-terminal cleavage/methylation domain-containing protein